MAAGTDRSVNWGPTCWTGCLPDRQPSRSPFGPNPLQCRVLRPLTGALPWVWVRALISGVDSVVSTSTRPAPCCRGADSQHGNSISSGSTIDWLSMAPNQQYRGGLVDAVVVGADRIAANGDVINKVGNLSAGPGLRPYRCAPSSWPRLSRRSMRPLLPVRMWSSKPVR